MNDTEFWRILSEEITTKRENIIHALMSGFYTDMAKYREDVGFLNGLKFVENTVTDIYNPKEKER